MTMLMDEQQGELSEILSREPFYWVYPIHRTEKTPPSTMILQSLRLSISDRGR